MARINKALGDHIEVVLPSEFVARVKDKFGPKTITLGSIKNTSSHSAASLRRKHENVLTPQGNVVAWDIPPKPRTFRWFGQGTLAKM